MSLAEQLLPEFDQEMATTRNVLERLPEDRFDWKPHPKSMTLVGVATHLANIPYWGASTLTDDSFDVEPVAGQPYVEEPAASRAALLEKFDGSVAAMRSALQSTTDEAMGKPWSLLRTGTPIFTLPRGAIVRSMILNHLIHHRAQLGMYLRLLDLPHPAMYGPSADEGGMM